MADFATPLQRTRARGGALKLERSSYFEHWREISNYLLPRSGRFLLTDFNKGQKKHNNIYDSSATWASRVLAAGLMAGMTSPARPWFRLATPDDALNERGSVKLWLDICARRMRNVFRSSNTYRSLHSQYEELAGFGVGADIVLDDFKDVLRHYPLEIGEYMLASNDRGEIDTLYREYEMTVAQVVEKFGIENCSVAVKTAYENGRSYDTWIPVVHVIEPRRDRDTRKRDGYNMPFKSCYFEYNRSDDKYLRESGFKSFPALVSRWATKGSDPYGKTCPGMETLGDIKQLQHQQLRKAQGIDFQTQPPLQVPTSMKNQEVQGQPGGVNYVDSTGPGTGIRSAFEVQLNLADLKEDILDVRNRIDKNFHVNLFLMLANDTRSNVTAREVAERHEEKLLMLGPTLENLHDELLSPLVDIAFEKMVAAGLMPPPPPELRGMDLNIEFVSVLAQAQRSVGLASVDRLLGTVGTIAPLKPEILDKIDTDQVVDAYADMLGVDPKLIVADDKVVLIRADRAKQQAAMQAAAVAPAAAQTAKTLSESDTEGKNALTDVMRQFSGY